MHLPATGDLLLDELLNDVKQKGLVLQSGLAEPLRQHSIILAFIDIHFQKVWASDKRDLVDWS
jgi:hypothetical protein